MHLKDMLGDCQMSEYITKAYACYNKNEGLSKNNAFLQEKIRRKN